MNTPAVVKPVGPDFCLVQLTALGAKLAGQGTLRYADGTRRFVFTPGQPLKVAKYEWDLCLSCHTSSHGQPLFELYTPPAAPAATTTPAQTTAEGTK